MSSYNNFTASNLTEWGNGRWGSGSNNNDHSLVSKQVIIAFNSLMAILGAFGNISAVIVLAFGKHNANPLNVLLLNLAIADLGVLFISFPVWSVKILIPLAWPFGKAMCKVLSASIDLFHVVSLATIVVIAIVRYQTIVHGIERRNWASKNIKLVVLFVWIFCFCTAAVPQMVSQTFFEQKYTDIATNATAYMRFCIDMELGHFNKVETFVALFVWYLVPLLITFLTFIRIHIFLNKHAKQIELHQSVPQSNVKAKIKSYHKVSKMLGAVVISFAVLMLPWNVIKLLKLLFDMQIEPLYGYLAGTLLILNSCLNPIIYYMMALEFRTEFKKKILTFKMRICETLLRCHNKTKSKRSTGNLLFVCASPQTTDRVNNGGESKDTAIIPRNDMYQRKKSLMAGHTKHNIDDVVSTLKRECSKLEETFI